MVIPTSVQRLAAVVLLLLLALPALGQSLSAEVDRTEVGLNETVTLKVRFEGSQASGSPDFSSLSTHFDILTNQKSMQHSIVNGDVSASTEWTLILAPRSAGQILIPPFTLQGQSSDPITLRVTDSPGEPVTGAEDVFLETQVSKDEVFVQEQLILTYRLFYNRNVDSLDKPDLKIDNARVEELPRVEYQRTIGHTPYGVAEFKFAVYSDASGTIEIPGAVWTVRANEIPSVGRFGFGGGRYQIYRPRTETVSVTVKPKPSAYPADKPWLPAKDLNITESWSRPPENFKLGEPLTRTLTVEADGVRAEQLPPIVNTPASSDFKFYPDQPTQDNRITSKGVQATRTESLAIVPSRAGELTLPEVAVTWWDTEDEQVRVASIPARTVQVAGQGPTTTALAGDGATQPTTAPGSATSTDSSPVLWLVLCLGLLTVALIFALLWWRQRQAYLRQSGTWEPGSGTGGRLQAPSLRKVVALCRTGTLPELRQALLQWAHQSWPNEPPFSLSDLAKKLDDPRFTQALMDLDAQLFGDGKRQVDTAAIESGVKRLAEAKPSAKTESALRPLYGER